MGDTWVYHHQDLGEPVHVDGSPISVSSADLFAFLGVDIEADDPLYEIPLSVGGGFERTQVFRVRLRLSSPGDHTHGVSWSLDLGARSRWRLPFAVLLGHPGWFDSFPTRIDATTSTVEFRFGSASDVEH